MNPEQTYRLLDSAMGAVLLHSNALLNHPEATDPDVRRTVSDLREGVQQAAARIAAAMGDPYPSQSP